MIFTTASNNISENDFRQREDPRPGARILGSTTGGCGEKGEPPQTTGYAFHGRARPRPVSVILGETGYRKDLQRVQRAGGAEGDLRRMLRQSCVDARLVAIDNFGQQRK